MKKILIGSFVGAIILFVWSFLAWAITPIHLHTFMYTPAQDAILKTLEENNVETGAYGIPMVDNRNVSGFDSEYQKKSEEFMKANSSKPAATIQYRKEGYDMSAMTLIRGFLFDFLASLAACILLAPGFAAMNSFFGRWWLVLLIGVVLAISGPLINFNWMGAPWQFTLDMVMDNLLNWGILGLWFAWYFRN
jgi:hypothetical protein